MVCDTAARCNDQEQKKSAPTDSCCSCLSQTLKLQPTSLPERHALACAMGGSGWSLRLLRMLRSPFPSLLLHTQVHQDQFLDKLQVERDRGITVKVGTPLMRLRGGSRNEQRVLADDESTAGTRLYQDVMYCPCTSCTHAAG